MLKVKKVSKRVYVPSAVSSFFEICDTEPDGSKIRDQLRLGARGGGFVIERGNTTIASISKDKSADVVSINGKLTQGARTSLKVIELMRQDHGFPPVKLSHIVEPPIGSGFGTSGAGAIGATLALSDLFELHLTLSQASDYAHKAEIQSVTGLGTVISLISGAGSVGLVTEPGSLSVGRVDSLFGDYDEYTLICACFGPIEKSTILLDQQKRLRINEFAKDTMTLVMRERTPEALLRYSRDFAEKTGLASLKLLELADYAKSIGAIGATQNMIGNAIHCLVPKSQRKKFLLLFSKKVGKNQIFESRLTQSGPRLF